MNPSYPASDQMDFQEEVIQRSYEVPVVVDFWAPWCGPCRVLGPALERLEAEANGVWELVKVNVDENPGVSREYQISGIPDVRMIFEGKEIAGFTGALTDVMIRKWLESHLPSEEKAALDQAFKLVKEGREHQAIPLLEVLLDEHPEMEEARILLARLLVFEEEDKATELVEEIGPQSPWYDIVTDIREIIRLKHTDTQSLEDLPVKKEYTTAIEALNNNDLDKALEHFIEVVMLNKGYDEEGARKACVAIFHLKGEAHPISRKWRKRFGMALY